MTGAVRARLLVTVVVAALGLPSCAGSAASSGASATAAPSSPPPAGACGLLDSRDEARLGLTGPRAGTSPAPYGVRTWRCTYTSNRPQYAGEASVVVTEIGSLPESVSFREDARSGLTYARPVLGIPALILDKGSACVVTLQASPSHTLAVDAPNGPEELDRTSACGYSIQIVGSALARSPDIPAALLRPETDDAGEAVAFTQPTTSMAPSIALGQQVQAQPVGADYAGATGDVVAFRPPESWTGYGTSPAALRVVAVGGEIIMCCDARNRVLVDGRPLDEPYLYYDPAAGPARQSMFGPIEVPPGSVWLMGDNRNGSADSRVPGFGPVAAERIVGRVEPRS